MRSSSNSQTASKKQSSSNIPKGKRIIYLDGQWVTDEHAKVSVFDHGFLYGDGIFEGLRIYNSRIFKLDEHLERLENSSKGIKLSIPMKTSKLRKIVVETVRLNGLSEGYIRLVISRGKGDLGIDPRNCKKPSVVVIANKVKKAPNKMQETGIHIGIANTRKPGIDILDGRWKCTHYLPNILAKQEAIQQELHDCFMLSDKGYVVEATTSNVFLVQGKELITPDCSLGALEGITRQTVMEIAAANGFKVREVKFKPERIHTAQECFITGTLCEIVPVVKVSGRQIGDGKIGPATKYLLDLYHKFVRNEGVPVWG